jgi:AcrR family transcriptional regulator
LAKRSYHHGDLRDALVRAAFAIAKREGPDAVTLRAVAKRAGVSEAAPYHHFADKRTLLGAAAGVGFEALDRRLGDALESAGRDPIDRLVSLGAAYVQFAIDEPGPFRLVFGSHVAELDLAALPETATPGRRAKERLRRAVREFVTTARANVDPEVLMQMLWAQVHGMAWLVVEKELHPEGASAASAKLTPTIASEAVRRLLASYRA